MPEFEWDENKNKKNTLKHKVNFEEAKTKNKKKLETLLVLTAIFIKNR